MKTSASRLWQRLALALPLALCITGIHVDAADAATKKKPHTRKATTQTTGKSHSLKVKNQQKSSGETTAERERRLYRECQGLPNAGACRGYTHR